MENRQTHNRGRSLVLQPIFDHLRYKSLRYELAALHHRLRYLPWFTALRDGISKHIAGGKSRHAVALREALRLRTLTNSWGAKKNERAINRHSLFNYVPESGSTSSHRVSAFL